MKAVVLRLAGIVAGLLLGLGVVEAGLRALEKNDRLTPADYEQDPTRLRAGAPPRPLDVAAIGDSQTWGVNAWAAEAWPQALGALSGKSVHNLGMSGHGPVEYAETWPRALALSPRAVVVALYLGNDLWDAYHTVYATGRHPELRRPDAPREIFTDTIGPAADAFMKRVMDNRAEHDRISSHRVGDWLFRHTAIGRMVRMRNWKKAYTANTFAADASLVRRNPGMGAVYEHAGEPVILLPTYRAGATDPDEPRIREGVRITREVLTRMRDESRARGVRLVVLVIPTKENVYADAMRGAGQVPDAPLQAVAERERRLRGELLSFCGEAGVECVDPLPALSGAVVRGEAIFPPYIDGHFNARGYAVLAEAVNGALARQPAPAGAPASPRPAPAP